MKRIIIATALLLVCAAGCFSRGVRAETLTISEAPEDTSTRALPISAIRALRVENENSRPVIFREEGEPGTLQAYVIYDDTAYVRLEAASSDNPWTLTCCDERLHTVLALSELLDPQRGVYVYESPMPDAEEKQHYTYVALLDGSAEEDPYFTGIYLLADDKYINELADDLRARGRLVTWEYGEKPSAAAGDRPQAYILHVIDQDGVPVPSMMINFCTDTTCSMLQADENGTISFDGEPDVYYVQLLKAPEGYSFDSDFEMYTDTVYGEWALRIRKE